MTGSRHGDEEQNVEIIAYTDRFSARPGEQVSFMVSTAQPSYDVAIIRHDHFFDTPNPDADLVIDADVNKSFPGREQSIAIGSYSIVQDDPILRLTGSFTIQTWICPSLPASGKEQGIVAKWNAITRTGYGFGIDEAGLLTAWVGNGHKTHLLKSPGAMIKDRWYAVSVRFDSATGELRLDWTMLRRIWLPEESFSAHAKVGSDALAEGEGALLIGASHFLPLADGRPGATACYNGKVDRVRIWGRALSDSEVTTVNGWGEPASIAELIAAWNPAKDIIGTSLPDEGPNELNGTNINQPTKAVCGANWDGTEVAFRLLPEHYGAIAYHEDDLEDCHWSVDFSYEIPAGMPSGLYAARMSAGKSIEYVPFYVRPAKGAPVSPVVYLAPTNTYLAYANERLFKASSLDSDFLEKTTTYTPSWTERETWIAAHPELGSSVYDLHPDGNGISYSTRLRPVVTMRPQFKLFINGCTRHFAADLYLLEWMEKKGFQYDVATDEDVHMEGLDSLSQYKVVVTGSHPEYWTTPMLNTLRDYLAGGGRVMYLGGNGFYWVTAIDSNRPYMVEVRRGINGTRAWTSHPGEIYLSLTGELGGLWRFRDLGPNRFVGIGFASEGWGGAEGYDQLPERDNPKAAFVFEGIAREETIGNFGLIMDGASGDEIDRYDLANGTPPETLRLATSEGHHTDYYQLVVEDTTMTLPGRGGREDPRVRADITLLEAPNGGAVFSVGSINWSGSLMTNDADNNVSKMTENVLRKFSE